jgi:hypothetical protein
MFMESLTPNVPLASGRRNCSSEASRAQCFNYSLNLIIKFIMSQCVISNISPKVKLLQVILTRRVGVAYP